MSTSPPNFKLPTSAKIALVIAFCIAFLILGGPAAFLYVAFVTGSALFWMYATWPYLLMALTASFAFGCWLGHVNHKGRLRVGLQLFSYTFLSGCAVYLIIGAYTLGRIQH